ncbi:MAG: WD40/YVTN/BNR-like repeat-containing protein, partial [Candidatus Limnocylindrales bacterium]
LQLVLAGSAGWILQNDRVVVNGSRLVQGAWQTWGPPCLDVNGPARLAASSATHLVAACLEGEWGSAPGGGSVSEHLYVSTDGGTSFGRNSAVIPLDDVSAIAAPTASTIVAGGPTASGDAVVISRDGGRTWTTVLRLGTVAVSYLGFTTATQGILVTNRDMRMTYDAGRTWQIVSF